MTTTITAPKPEAIAAYRTDIIYKFGLTLTQRGQEMYGEVETTSPMFMNVLQSAKAKYPDWSFYESWEIAPAAPAAELARTAADAQISRHYRKLAAAA